MRFLAIIFLYFFIVWPVSAHPGNDFDENNCHTCLENCQNFGLELNELHCHDENGIYLNSLGQVFNNQGNLIYEDKSYSPSPEEQIIIAEPPLDEVKIQEESKEDSNIVVSSSTKELIDNDIVNSKNNFPEIYPDAANDNIQRKALEDNENNQGIDKSIIEFGFILIAIVFLLLAIFLIIKYKNKQE